MKKLQTNLFITVLTMFMFSSCTNTSSKNEDSEKLKNSGDVIVENGAGEKDTISFTCTNCTDVLTSKKEFDILVKEATERTRNSMNYPLSFKPQGISLTIIKEDSLISAKTKKKIKDVVYVIAEYKYIAKNGYGNELEGESSQSFYIQNSKIVDLEDEIQLEPLAYKDGYINRSLELYSHDGTENLSLFPGKKGSIIVTSSLGCVDDGTWLILILENNKEIKLISWNDFNCDGSSYFEPLTTSQKEKIKSHRLKKVQLVDDKSMICIVPFNQSDYLQQLITLLK